MSKLLRFKVFIASLRLFSGNHSFKTNISAPPSAGASRLKGLSIYEHSVSFPYGCLVRPEYCGRSWLAGDTYALATALRLLGFGKKKRRSVRFRSLPAQAPPLLGGSRRLTPLLAGRSETEAEAQGVVAVCGPGPEPIQIGRASCRERV